MRKKLLLVIIAVLGVFGLVACGQTTTEATTAAPTTEAPTTVEGDTTAAPTTAAPTTAAPDLDWDLDATYRTYISGVENMNPYSETLGTTSDMNYYLTDSLYTGDYDWATAIEQGIATEEGDFSGGAENLPYGRFPAMAAGEPVDVNGDGITWTVTLRTDLAFEDGTPIDAHTFEYSWSQLLDPKLLNARASSLYDSTSLPVAGAEAYYKQLSPDEDGLGFEVYQDTTDNNIKYTRENSYWGTDTGGNGWDLYLADFFEYGVLAGPTEAVAEPWGGTYGTLGNGWILEDTGANYFVYGDDDILYAPSAGWTLDGVAMPTVDDMPDDVGGTYAGVLPAYADSTGARVDLDDEGAPLNAEYSTDDAIPVAWSEVGIKADETDDYVLHITLSEAKTAWDFKGQLLSGITGVVHEVQYEAGMNTTETQTNYGTIDNPLVSYGPYTLTTWEDGVVFIFDARDEYYASDDFRIRHVRYEWIEDQSIAVEEFRAGELDIVGASGDYYDEFKYSPYMKLTPSTTFFRFAFNIEGSTQYDLNPILVYPEFRQAFYYAIDREEFALEVRAPSHPTQAFLGPVYLSTEYNSIPYRGSEAGQSVVEDFAPETNGYDPVLARSLFDTAYDLAIADGTIIDGDTVHVEYKFYDVETNWKVANWVKSTVEAIFNDVTAAPRFILDLVAVSDSALDDAWDNGHFEMTFGGWRGMDFDAPGMIGFVYNSTTIELGYMLERGFETATMEVTVEMPDTLAAVQGWIADYQAMTDPTEAQTEQYDAWVAMLTKFDLTTGVLTCTYDELYNYAYYELYNVKDVDYPGKQDDFDRITAAMETVLMEEMIAIPLFTTVSATVYSSRVVFEADSYHAWMGWGGFKYMYIAAED